MLLEIALGAWAVKNLKDIGAGKVIKDAYKGAKEGIAEVKAEKSAKQTEQVASAVIKGLMANSTPEGKQAIENAVTRMAAEEQRQKTAA